MKFHILGISHKGVLEMILDGDDKDEALAEVLEFAPGYRQLFLVETGYNAKELKFTPETPAEYTPATPAKVEEGGYMVMVRGLDDLEQ